MAKPGFNRERSAEILLEAYLLRDDKRVAKAHGITDRTIRAYRQRLDTDAEFAALFLAKKSQATDAWLERVPGALVASIDFLQRAAVEGDPKNPDMVHSVAGAMKLIGELSATWRIVDARVARQAGAATTPARPLPAGAPEPGASAGTGLAH